MRLLYAFLALTLAAMPAASGQSAVRTTIPAGTLLELALPARVPMQGRGEMLTAALAQPVYVQDRLALPAGTLVRGRITAVRGPRWPRRVVAAMGGDFRPPDQVTVRFVGLQTSPGHWVAIVAPAAPAEPALNMVQTPAAGSVHTGRGWLHRLSEDLHQRLQQSRRQLHALWQTQTQWASLKAEALDSLPYHPLALAAGTRYQARLQAPVTVPGGPVPAAAPLPRRWPAGLRVYARLESGLDSATARLGTPVRATLLRPALNPAGQMLLPQGTQLLGTVVQAQPARWLGRGGKLNFDFTRIVLPQGGRRNVEADLRAAALPSGARLNREGAAQATAPGGPAPYVALTVALAFAGSHGDADNAWTLNAGSGTHLQLWGTAMAALLAHLRPLALGLGLLGSGRTIYRRWIGRGPQMVFPQGTELIIALHPPNPGRALPLPAGARGR